MNLQTFLTKAAAAHPEKTAVVCDGERISYGMLQRRAQKLAAALYQLGVRKSAPAGILLNNSIEYVEILFALMRLGAVGVPLNTRLTAAEIRATAEHAGMAVLFYGADLEDKAPLAGSCLKTAVILGGRASDAVAYESLFEAPSAALPDQHVAEQDHSFILYTAGTTGMPKGVVLTHGSQLCNTRNYVAGCHMAPDDIELAPTPLFHASTLGRVFTYVCRGMTFILLKKFDPEACFSLIQAEQVTSLTQAPTMYRMMLEAAGRRTWDTRTVRRAVTGASAITAAAKHDLKELFPKAGFFDVYGLTEASPGVSVLGPADFFRKIDTVGKPMLSVEVSITGDDGTGLPAGREGEICCRGPNIMKGYHKDPGATAAALTGGWLHTGDRGLLDDEGFLSIAGRNKELIISGGVNIYPGEIEAVLLQHPAVYDAAAFGVPDDTWGEKTVAAVVLRQGAACSQGELIGFCRERLAGFKCPRAVLFVSVLPRNAAQKVLKQEMQKKFAGSSGH